MRIRWGAGRGAAPKKSLRNAKRGWRRFCDDCRGSFAVMFGLSTLPLIAMAGAAVDLSQAVSTRARLAQAVDAAGLAAGAASNATRKEIIEIAQQFFDANFVTATYGVPGTLNVDVNDDRIRLSATADVETGILKMIGVDAIDISVVSEVVKEVKNIEVVLVLDNTGSMASSGKMDAMKQSATELVKILFGDTELHPHLRISVVPFVTAVNIRHASAFDMDWMDVQARSRYHGAAFENSDGDYFHDPAEGPVNHFDLFDAVGNTEWKGCVEARPAPYDIRDTAPDPDNPDTLWVPYFWPDEPTGGSYNNNWINYSGSVSNKRNQQKDVSHYADGPWSIDETPKGTSGPNKACPRPLLPLSNSKSQVLEEIDAMEAHYNGGTNVAQGMAWGWRVLSPGVPFTEGAPYGDPDTQKVIVVLTDGHNFVVNQNNHNDSDYNAYGYLSEERLGTDNNSVAASRVADRMTEVCDSVKDKDIRVYSIVFMLNNLDVQEKFKDCASNPRYYFNSPSKNDLNTAFQTIATDLNMLRIAM